MASTSVVASSVAINKARIWDKSAFEKSRNRNEQGSIVLTLLVFKEEERSNKGELASGPVGSRVRGGVFQAWIVSSALVETLIRLNDGY